MNGEFRIIHEGTDITDMPIKSIIPSDVDKRVITLQIYNMENLPMVDIKLATDYPIHDVIIPNTIGPGAIGTIIYAIDREEMMWKFDKDKAEQIITCEWEKHIGHNV